ncbi:MAG: GntR family transcriptional regulator [Victivallales bacterium]|nr:GntR family transcriptional regulator [Victivallales bacterium]
MPECKKDRIYTELRQSILDNILPQGSRLPPEVELAHKLGVGHVTLRSALARLEAEGLVERFRSRGTFVAERSRHSSYLLLLPDGLETLDTPSRYVLAGIEAYAENRLLNIERCPISLFLSLSPGQRQEIKQNYRLKGIILETGHLRTAPALVKALQEMELPVAVPHALPQDNLPADFFILQTDERQALADSYAYLVSKGHHRIAGLFVAIPGEIPDVIRGYRRHELWRRLKKTGVDYDESLLALIPNEMVAIRETVRAWMSLPSPPTAMLCQSDRVAFKALAELHGLGLDVPGQISVMGYSNYPGSQLVTPALTTIDTDLKVCAKMALEQLENAQKGGGLRTSTPIFTPYQLIERASVAAPSIRRA